MYKPALLRKLFSEVSRLIFDMVQDHLNEAAKNRVETAAVLCFQSFGEFLRWHLHSYESTIRLDFTV